MNMVNQNRIHQFLRKLNTITNYKELSKEVTTVLVNMCQADVCWICLINFETGKVDYKRFYYTEAALNDIEGKICIVNIGLEIVNSSQNNNGILKFFMGDGVKDSLGNTLIEEYSCQINKI